METLDVAVVIVLDGPRMLVNRRPEGSYFGGWWEWPGGKRREGESFEDCARRELREEVGLEVRELREFDRRAADYPSRRINLVYFIGRGSRRHSEAALEHRWLTAAEVRQLRFLEANLPVLERLERELAPGRQIPRVLSADAPGPNPE